MSINTFPELSETAEHVLKERYYLKDSNNNVIEDVDSMLRRVASNIAKHVKISIEDFNEYTNTSFTSFEELFYTQMRSLKFLPNSPTLMNAGTDIQQLAACFVLPVEDSLDAIFTSIRDAALIHKSGGGTGFSFSKLRPTNSAVKSTQGVSSGPISFMSVFNAATEVIKQGSKRRGANMGVLSIDHPDIEEFINCKRDKTKLNNFNLSVGITDKFMNAVKNNGKHKLINPKTGLVSKIVDARYLWDMIVDNAWLSGEPGVLFLDEINRHNPNPEQGDMESTNPCGEQPLLPYEACNLASINLSRFVSEHNTDGSDCNKIDWMELYITVATATVFLDATIDANNYPLPKITEVVSNNRKVGLGVMGFADMLMDMDIAYDSKVATDLAAKLSDTINTNAHNVSKKLVHKNTGSKNSTLTTIAPTGTISMIASVSGGIEPHFALAYYKQVMDGKKFPEVVPSFRRFVERHNIPEDVYDHVATLGSVDDYPHMSDELKSICHVSHNISGENHVYMQAAWQMYVDNAVSKTINMPNDATRENISDIYMLAWEHKCKGTTVYRDGSRDGQVLNVGTDTDDNSSDDTDINESYTKPTMKDRPKTLTGKTVEMITGCGKLYVTVNMDEDNNPFEVFTSMGKAGGCAQSQCEAIGRLASTHLRSGGSVNEIIKQLKGISCHMKHGMGPNATLSCSDALAKAVEYTIYDVPRLDDQSDIITTKQSGAGACPDCGGQIHMSEGCMTCASNCGWSKCS